MNKTAHNGALLPFVREQNEASPAGKRVFFNKRLNNKELMEEQLRQITDKKNKRRSESIKNKKEDLELLQNIKAELMKEQMKKYSKTAQIHNELKEHNDKKIYERELNKSLEKNARVTEKFSYFPFTSGEEVERKRLSDKETLKHELREKLAMQAHSSANGSMAGGRALSPSHTPQPLLPGRGHDAKQVLNYNRVPMNFAMNYPGFLIPDKQNPYTTKIPPNVEHVVNDAFRRYENELRQKEEEKMNDQRRYFQMQEDNRKYMAELERKKKEQQERMRQDLQAQIDADRGKRMRDRVKDKEFVRTNYGPEEDDYTWEKFVETDKTKKNTVKNDLLQQIKEKQDKLENEKMQERIMDVEGILQIE